MTNQGTPRSRIRWAAYSDLDPEQQAQARQLHGECIATQEEVAAKVGSTAASILPVDQCFYNVDEEGNVDQEGIIQKDPAKVVLAAQNQGAQSLFQRLRKLYKEGVRVEISDTIQMYDLKSLMYAGLVHGIEWTAGPAIVTLHPMGVRLMQEAA